MTRLRFLLLLFLCVGVLADAKEDQAAKLKKEQERIKRRKEFKKAFTAPEKLVAEKIETFALEPIRNWEKALASLAKDTAVANPVRYYLLDEDWEVQAFACKLAGVKALVALVPELYEAYDAAAYPIIRRKAVEAVAAFAKGGKLKATPKFLTVAQADEEPGVRFLAVEGLEWLKNVDALRASVKDNDHDTRYRAQAAMARLGDGETQRMLLKDFRSYVSTKDLQRRPSLEIYDVGERYSQFLNCMALGYWGGHKGVKLLSRAVMRREEYKNKLFLSIGSAVSLGQSHPEDGKAAAERVRTIKEAMRGGDAMIRAMGAFGAGYTGDPQFLRGLTGLLRDAQEDVRHNAVEAIGRIPGDGSVKLLVGVVKTARDVPMRLAAVRGLLRHDTPESVEGLARALKDKRYMVRIAAARMLGRKGIAAAPVWKALAKATRDRDYGVREAAVVALARCGAPEGLDALVESLRDRDDGVKVRALRALARHRHADKVRDNKEAAQRAVSVLLKGEPALRKAARECLTRVRSPHSVPPLIVALDAKSYAQRSAAFSVLRDYNAGKTMNYAPKLAQNERRKAIGTWKAWWKEGGPIRALPPPPKKRSNQDLPSFHKYTRDLRWRGIDLVICYDSTGSMIPVIRAVKQRIDVLIEESARIVTNLRLSLFTYRDEGEEYVYYGTPLTYATDNLKAFVQVAEANRGGDLPEAVTKTVVAAIDKLDWRKEAQKVIVVIGDAPYHPENAGQLIGAVRAFARTENRGTVHAIYTDPNRLGESIGARKGRSTANTTFPFLNRLEEMAKAGKGKAITIEDTEMLISELLVLSFGERWRAELESRLDFE
ncbi:MAG: HEAT repeat domain-containing protein [Planctomycetota bacterium]